MALDAMLAELVAAAIPLVAIETGQWNSPVTIRSSAANGRLEVL